MPEPITVAAAELVVWYDLAQSSSFHQRSILSLAAAEGADASASISP